MIRLTCAALVALGLLFEFAPFAEAATSCSGIMSNKTINGDLLVSTGKACELDGVIVFGSVHVERGGFFFVQISGGGQTTIHGDLIAVHCATVAWAPSLFVAGNVQIADCAGPSNQGGPEATIGGNFICIGNATTCVLGRSTVGGNAQFNHNSGGVTVEQNDIGGNLQCLDNPASVVTVSSNSVAGNKQGQCVSDVGN